MGEIGRYEAMPLCGLKGRDNIVTYGTQKEKWYNKRIRGGIIIS